MPPRSQRASWRLELFASPRVAGSGPVPMATVELRQRSVETPLPLELAKGSVLLPVSARGTDGLLDTGRASIVRQVRWRYSIVLDRGGPDRYVLEVRVERARGWLRRRI